MSAVSNGDNSFDVSITIETDPSPAYEGSAGTFLLTVENAGPGTAPGKFAGTDAIPIVDAGAYVVISESTREGPTGGPFAPCTLITAQSRGGAVAFGFYVPELEAKQTLSCNYSFEVLSGLNPEFQLTVFLEHQDDINPSNNRVLIPFGGLEPYPVPAVDIVGLSSLVLLLIGASLLIRGRPRLAIRG